MESVPVESKENVRPTVPFGTSTEKSQAANKPTTLFGGRETWGTGINWAATDTISKWRSETTRPPTSMGDTPIKKPPLASSATPKPSLPPTAAEAAAKPPLAPSSAPTSLPTTVESEEALQKDQPPTYVFPEEVKAKVKEAVLNPSIKCEYPYIIARVTKHGVCKSMQTDEEEAALDPQRYKSVLCRNFQTHKECPYGARCVYAHGSRELRSVQQNIISLAHIMPLLPKDLPNQPATVEVPPTPPRSIRINAPASASRNPTLGGGGLGDRSAAKLPQQQQQQQQRNVRFDHPGGPGAGARSPFPFPDLTLQSPSGFMGRSPSKPVVPQ